MPSARVIALSGFIVVGFAGNAWAHAHLKSATPAMKAKVLSAPHELSLTFSEGVNLPFTGVKITGPDGSAVPVAASNLKAGGDTTLVVPLAAPLGSGLYKVDWHALANDGHKTTGSYTFTIAP